MPIGTPFHRRTSVLCASQNWRTWSGYFVASSYDVVHDYEYHAIRNSAGLIDVSPLYKYDVRGRDALKLVNRVITRDAAKCAVGQALYSCLCEDDGAVIQDGTLFRLAEDHFLPMRVRPKQRRSTSWKMRLPQQHAEKYPNLLPRVFEAVSHATSRSFCPISTSVETRPESTPKQSWRRAAKRKQNRFARYSKIKGAAWKTNSDVQNRRSSRSNSETSTMWNGDSSNQIGATGKDGLRT